jgi:hypothetical protein
MFTLFSNIQHFWQQINHAFLPLFSHHVAVAHAGPTTLFTNILKQNFRARHESESQSAHLSTLSATFSWYLKG